MQQTFFQSTQSQESMLRHTKRGWWKKPMSPGLSQLPLCLNTGDMWAGSVFHIRNKVSHLPSSLQGSATLQRGGRVALPWGMPGHHSTMAASKLHLQDTWNRQREVESERAKVPFETGIDSLPQAAAVLPQLKILQITHQSWLTKILFFKMQLQLEVWTI